MSENENEMILDNASEIDSKNKSGNINVESSLLSHIISFLERVIGGIGILVLVVVLIYLAILLMIGGSCGLDTECRRDCIDNMCDD